MKFLWKEQAHKLLDELPAEATLTDLLHELVELQTIERALADRAAGRLVPHEEAKALVMAKIRRPSF